MQRFPTTRDPRTQRHTIFRLAIYVLAILFVIYLLMTGAQFNSFALILFAGLMAAFVLLAFGLAPRAVQVEKGVLIVERNFGRKRYTLTPEIDVRRLAEVEIERPWGIMSTGGLFSWTGRFHTQDIGYYTGNSNRLDNSVLVNFGPRAIVISADDPAALVSAIQTAKPAR